MTDRLILTLGVLGGTGKVGQGLARRWAAAGYHVIVGSRELEKAEGAAAELNEKLGRDLLRGLRNPDAASQSDIAVLTVPYEAQGRTLEGVRTELQGKLLVDVVVPLVARNAAVVERPPAGSAAQEAQQILGDGVRVVAAFQNVSHVHLQGVGPVPCDVFVCGDSTEAKEQVLQLVKAAGMVGWDAGPLQNASVPEGLTSVLIGINRRYGLKHAGVRITAKP